jgi:succinate dehydrogenase/fumarate reductase flavoprotein subunit
METIAVTVRMNSSEQEVPLTYVHTLVLGSGAAGLNAAAQLRLMGVDDVMILTEGLSKGTSINTGSDKQTYYKLSMCGTEADSPFDMARTYFANGATHGDLALVESSLSARAFLNLVNLGVPFPRDMYGQFVGYKTDHDPKQRATSIGPYTSREMCHKLIAQVRSLGIPIREGRTAVELVKSSEDRVCGLIAISDDGALESYAFENLVFAVGGPGGLYKSSVYPAVHNGAIGIALKAGAKAVNLPESQYGLASIKFRWNVSGTYMQVIPRLISTAADGKSDQKEFLRDYFRSPGEMFAMVFLKGYQWPFDARKVIGGSSLVDLLVYLETEGKNRRVFLDFRTDPDGYRIAELPEEARLYLEKSGANQPSPILRLAHMNPGAIQLYKDHGIDLEGEPLEVSICAQHNNGGLAGNIWWESTNIKHLFPIGEVNGSHGVARPGGSALNSGQVAGLRAAEFIAHRYQGWTIERPEVQHSIGEVLQSTMEWLEKCQGSSLDWSEERKKFMTRMSESGAHIRSAESAAAAVSAAYDQYQAICDQGCRIKHKSQAKQAFQVKQLCLAHAVYLDAIKFAIDQGVGSRGSAIILDESGGLIHEKLDHRWRIAAENPDFRSFVLETVFLGEKCSHGWVKCRPIPEEEVWFETVWSLFREGKIYRTS